MTMTYMQAVYEGMCNAVDAEPGPHIRGMNKDELRAAVKAVTEALDTLPIQFNLHSLLYAVTFVRNSLLYAMEHNQQETATRTGGNT